MATKIITPIAGKASPVAKSVAGKRASVVKPKLAKPAVKKTVKPTASKPAAPKPVLLTAKLGKLKKPKLVRDSFTMPKDEFAAIAGLKLRAGKWGRAVKKSELIRAGIKALAAMSDIQFKAALSNVPTLNTDRPKDIK